MSFIYKIFSSIDNRVYNIRCVSYSHAAFIIGVSHQSISNSINQNRFICKGWKLRLCDDIIYNENFALKNIDLFDDDVIKKSLI